MLPLSKIKKIIANNIKLNKAEKESLRNRKDTVIKKVALTKGIGYDTVFVEITNPNLNNDFKYKIIGFIQEKKFLDYETANYNNCLDCLAELTHLIILPKDEKI